MSEYYQLRRTAIKDLAAYCSFLAGFLGSAPFAWQRLAAHFESGNFVRGLSYFLGIVSLSGLILGAVGLVLGSGVGRAWEWYHRKRRTRLASRHLDDEPGGSDGNARAAKLLVTAPGDGSSEQRGARAPLQLVTAESLPPVNAAAARLKVVRSSERNSILRSDTPAGQPREIMTEQLWNSVDEYFAGKLVPDDPVLTSALEESAAAGLPAIAVTPLQGKLLQMLATLVRAERILEIGTLGGYSTIWLARALHAGGRVVTLESESLHADVARKNLRRAGLQDVVDVRLGRALDTLPMLASEQSSPFDLVFIDADKENIPGYFDWALELSREGALIIVDNVVREGAVADPESEDPRVHGVRRLTDALSGDTRVTATVVQTVGAKGYDGFLVALVRDPRRSEP